MHRLKILLWLLLSVALSSCATPRSRPLIPTTASPVYREQQPAVKNDQLGYLRTTIKRLRVDVDNNRREMDKLRQQLLDMQAQLAANTTSTAPTAPSNTTPRQADDDGAASATDIYLQAFSAFSNNDMDSAISGFSRFLQQFPRNPYAVNACFWQAKAYLQQNNLAAAQRSFERVLQYPQGSKSADALLQLAVIAVRNNQIEQARTLLTRLQQQYPHSSAAQNIPRQLRALRQ